MPRPLHLLTREGWQWPCPLAAVFSAFWEPQRFPAPSDSGQHRCDRLIVERKALRGNSPGAVTPSHLLKGLKSDSAVSREALPAQSVDTLQGQQQKASKSPFHVSSGFRCAAVSQQPLAHGEQELSQPDALPSWASLLLPDWCGSVGWALSHKAESCQFDSRSGHAPG